MDFDWTLAITRNRKAILAVLEEIFALLELALDGTVKRLPKVLYLAAERLMAPTESAVRRLIVVLARGMKLELKPSRPMPKGLVIVRKRTEERNSFQLFDPRKRLEENEAGPVSSKAGPHVWSLESFLEQGRPVPAPEPATSLDATSLCKRFLALQKAMETLPAQAKRLARWKLRRAKTENPKFRSPLRPGPPPGNRNKPKLVIDFILKDCHGLAYDALKEDSS